MFIIVQCLPFLFFTLLWFVFGKTAKSTILTLSVLILSLAYTSFYLNGGDWVNYYVNFYTHNGSSWFEPGFLLLYSLLRFIASENFGIATLPFYTTAFPCLILAANKNKKCNVPASLFFILLFFGNTPMLEQLRQFTSVIIVFCTLQSEMQGKGLKTYIYVVVSATFRVSAVMVLLSLILADMKSKKIFILSMLLLGVGLTSTFVNDSAISLGMQLIPTIFIKIRVYNGFTNVNFYIGPSMLLALTLLDYYSLSIYKLLHSHVTESTFLQQQAFPGGIIFFIGVHTSFISRLASYYIIFFFYDIACSRAPRYSKLYEKDGFLLVFILLFISSNLFSYYKNSITPVKLEQLTFNFLPPVSGEIDYKKHISDIFYKNVGVLSGFGVEEEK